MLTSSICCRDKQYYETILFYLEQTFVFEGLCIYHNIVAVCKIRFRSYAFQHRTNTIYMLAARKAIKRLCLTTILLCDCQNNSALHCYYYQLYVRRRQVKGKPMDRREDPCKSDAVSFF